MLNTIKSIKTRYSCRAFTDKMPSDEDLQTIAEAAVCSPSASNFQPWRIIIVKNRELLNELETEAMKFLEALDDNPTYELVMSRGGKIYYNALCQMIIPIRTPFIRRNAFNDNKWANIDCGIVAQNIALAAESLGINSLICGMIDLPFESDKGDYFKDRLNFPKGYEVGISVLLGYAAEPYGEPHEPDLTKISVVE